MRTCPVCNCHARDIMWGMDYKIPDGWPLPEQIVWYTCNDCGMLYGDGYFNQKMLDKYYSKYYGYGVNSDANIARLKGLAYWISDHYTTDSVILDFGGAGDNGRSVIFDELKFFGFHNVVSTGAGDKLPGACDLIVASHVLEHVYALSNVVRNLLGRLKRNGRLIVDGPDSARINVDWPILDFNTKHINHFTLRNYLDLGNRFGMEMVELETYEMGEWPCYRIHFKQMHVGWHSRNHVVKNIDARVKKLKKIDYPVNVWGLSDVTWHLLSKVDLDIVGFIDNDPAYRGQTIDGKPVLSKIDNDAPIVIMAQGQRKKLIENIRAMGVTNKIVEI